LHGHTNVVQHAICARQAEGRMPEAPEQVCGGVPLLHVPGQEGGGQCYKLRAEPVITHDWCCLPATADRCNQLDCL
jgi:hypothetical protein